MCNTMKKNYSVQATSKTTRLTPLNTTIPISPIELHTTKQLTLDGKGYLCFQINKISSHDSQCVKSWILNKAVDYILSTDTFEQHFFAIKYVLKSPRIEDHMKTIGIDQ